MDVNRQPARNVVVRPLGRYEIHPMEWLWAERIPRGELTVIAGDGGLGKSTLAALIGAQVSNGTLKGSVGLRGVWVLLGEDDPGRVLQARFRAAGADMTRVGVIAVGHRDRDGRGSADDLLTFPDDLEKLADAVRKNLPDLLIVDPLSAFVGPSVDTHRDGGKGGMRAVLGPLAAMAREYGVTVLCLAHLNKGRGPADQRIAGTVGLRNAARNLLIMAPHPNAHDSGLDDGRRVLGHDKINGEVKAPTLDIQIVGVTASTEDGSPVLRADGTRATTSLARIGGVSSVDYRDALAAASADTAAVDAPLTRAEDLVREALAAGPIPSTELQARAESEGISERTLRRARRSMGVQRTKTANGWMVHLGEVVGRLGPKPEIAGRTTHRSGNAANAIDPAALPSSSPGVTDP